MNFYSHKWANGNDYNYRYLHDHLKQVGEMSFNLLNSKGINDINLKKSSLIIGALHDFGKYTSYFQDHLLKETNEKYSQHSFISALYASFCACKNLLPDEFIIYIYLSIKHHHGNLCNLDVDIGYDIDSNYNISENLRIVEIQINDISKNKENIKNDLSSVINLAGNHDINLDYIDEFIENYKEAFNKLIKININIKKKNLNVNYISFLFLYSLLIDNDKRNASGTNQLNRVKLDYKLINNFENNFVNKESVDTIRRDLYETVNKNIENAELKNHFFTITAPTGAGKTIAGLSAAMKLRQRLESDYDYRIIYTLPFTTIIDQNYQVANDIFSNIGYDFNENHERYLLKHHHLSISAQRINGEDLPLDESLMLVEDWDSEIIFTTFIQLFDALGGYRNKSLKKYHRIYKSIIIMDEIQSIDISKWDTIKFLMRKYAEYFNVYFIIMTATQPELFPDALELNSKREDMFNEVNRVKMTIDKDKSTPEKIIEKYFNYEYKSILFVFNTIKSSIEGYDALKKMNDCKYHIFYLSANLIPHDRYERLKEIKHAINANENIRVVSTQIFEAGIDISFDVIVRDIAPIDSLIQSSGRVNRNGKSSTSPLFVVNCTENGKDGYYCELIYGKSHKDKSLKILQNYKEIKEKDYPIIIKSYYENVYLPSEPQIEDAIEKLDFDGNNEQYYVSKFSVLDDQYKYISIFIERNKEAKDIFNQYKELRKNPRENNKFYEVRSKLYDYIISVGSIAGLLVTEKINDHFYIAHLDSLNTIYDQETGLKTNYKDAMIL